jgi:hypothetical protein
MLGVAVIISLHLSLFLWVGLPNNRTRPCVNTSSLAHYGIPLDERSTAGITSQIPLAPAAAGPCLSPSAGVQLRTASVELRFGTTARWHPGSGVFRTLGKLKLAGSSSARNLGSALWFASWLRRHERVLCKTSSRVTHALLYETRHNNAGLVASVPLNSHLIRGAEEETRERERS